MTLTEAAKPGCPFCGSPRDDIDDATDYVWFECGTHGKADRLHVENHCRLRTELAEHKQRLAAQSARLAAAESEVRRLRRAIDDAPSQWGARIDGQLYYCPGEGTAKACGDPVRCKLVPIDELEASDGG